MFIVFVCLFVCLLFACMSVAVGACWCLRVGRLVGWWFVCSLCLTVASFVGMLFGWSGDR